MTRYRQRASVAAERRLDGQKLRSSSTRAGDGAQVVTAGGERTQRSERPREGLVRARAWAGRGPRPSGGAALGGLVYFSIVSHSESRRLKPCNPTRAGDT